MIEQVIFCSSFIAWVLTLLYHHPIVYIFLEISSPPPFPPVFLFPFLSYYCSSSFLSSPLSCFSSFSECSITITPLSHHFLHPASGSVPYVSAVPASTPRGPSLHTALHPFLPRRRRLCRLISSEIGELQASAHRHQHFSCHKRHFSH